VTEKRLTDNLKESLARLLQQQDRDLLPRQLSKIDIQDIMGLTPLQEGMLYHYLNEPGSDTYMEQLILGIVGEIDLPCFESAWNAVIVNNEMLRTVFRWKKLAHPTQIVLKKHKIKPRFFDLTDYHHDERDILANEIKNADRNESFNLSDVPFRVTLCKMSPQRYSLFISNHHILFDGWSLGIILEEFFSVYHAGIANLLPAKADTLTVKTPFKAFLQTLKEHDETQYERFWQDYLGGMEAVDNALPVKNRPHDNQGQYGSQGKRIKTYHIDIKGDEKEQLEILIKDHKITWATLLYTCWGVLLQNYCNRQDVLFGGVLSGRSANIKGIENMVGLFINTLPIRVKSDDNDTVSSLLLRMRGDIQQLENYEDTPLVKIKQYNQWHDRQEFFDTLLVVENYPMDIAKLQALSHLTVDHYEMIEVTHYDLTIVIRSIGDTLGFDFIYPAAAFDSPVIESLGSRFARLLTQFPAHIEQPVASLDMLTDKEKQQLITDFNSSQYDHPTGTRIHDIFATQVQRSPGRAALVSNQGILTYRDVDEKSSHVAANLLAQGVLPGSIVAVIMNRSFDLVITILGILKAGAAYLPISPDFPAERISYILADSGAKVVIEEQRIRQIAIPQSSHASEPSECCLAYVIYTSGSTGKPKGVMVEHDAVVNLLCTMQRRYPISQEDTYLFKTSYLFDVSVTELFGWFMGGGALAVPAPGEEKDPQALIDMIKSRSVTHINFVPTQFNAFLEWLTDESALGLSSLKYIFLAGEALLPETVRRFKELKLSAQIPLENLYGPTEATVYASGYSLSQWQSQYQVPIGKPLDNMVLYILNRHGHLQSIGVPGELCISGSGLARGYLNRPQLTAERFINNSYEPQSTHKIYKTGDLARWLPDGNIEYLGRLDHQVKVRGYRIELGEIESCLLASPHVQDVVVVTKKDQEDDTYLVAYVVPGDHASVTAELLKEYLKGILPDYMVPSLIDFLERMPLTATGKVDRRALPAVEGTILSHREYAAPRNDRENQLVFLWQKYAGLENYSLGIDDNFFQVGGHSLKAMRLLTAIHKHIDIEVPLPVIFANPTVRKFSRYLESAESHAFSALLPVEEKEYYPLTPAQKRFYITQQRNPEDISYNIPEIMLLEGLIDRDRFLAVIHKLIVRHESLRTSFHMVAGEPVQKIHPVAEIAFEIQSFQHNTAISELTGKDSAWKSQYITSLCHDEIIGFMRPFDLSLAPLFRIGIIEVAMDTHVFMFDMHHIIADGTSIRNFITESLILFTDQKLTDLNIRYRDYVQWREIEMIRWQEKLDREKRASFNGDYGILDLPADFVRPPVLSFSGDMLRFYSSAKENTLIKEMALKQDVTVYMLLFSIFSIFLAKLSGHEEIMVGSPIAGRQHTDIDDVIGLFINTVVLTASPYAAKTFEQLAQEVKEQTLQVYEYQEFQYDHLLQETGTNAQGNQSNLFSVMFVLQNMDLPEIEFPGIKVTRHIIENRTAKFDITFYCEEINDEMEFAIEYSTDLFRRETIERYSRYFIKLMRQVLAHPSVKIGQMEIISDRDREQILVDFNTTDHAFPFEQTIIEVIADQATRTPGNVALIGSRYHQLQKGMGPSIEKLTFKQLNEKTNRLARLLRDRGVGTGSVVGIMMIRSLDVIIGLLAIMKAGGTYVPIDPEYPENRINNMLEHSQANALVTLSGVFESKPLPPSQQYQVLMLDSLEAESLQFSHTPLDLYNRPDDLIYIIFTSGSTGVPKGAGVYHRSFMNLMYWYNTEFQLGENDVNLLLTSVSFDLTQKNLYSPLMTGGSLCIPRINYFDPLVLMQDIYNHKVTLINCTPSMFARLVEFEMAAKANKKQLSSLRYIFLGGEPIAMASLLPWLESEDCRGQIVNTYGPTECTDICAAYRIEDPRRFLTEAVPIGKPVYNVRLYIPDGNLNLLPVGIAGELLIGGTGVGIGYVNDREMTAAKFIRHSFAPGEPEQRLYHTGDLTRWLPDGNIEFLGRIDHQVKVRGFRIELGEIENQLTAHATVKEALVMAKDADSGDKYLCAYIVPLTMEGYLEQDLRDYLIADLPDYMVPAYFVALEKMPLNPNGKIDRKALPEPDITANRNFVAPVTETELLLVDIWADVLSIDKELIGVQDNFFQLGGHSLKVAGLAGKIHQAFSVEVSIVELFKSPTIAAIAKMISGTGESLYESIPQVEITDHYPLSPAQKRLFVVQQMDLADTSYNLPGILILKGELEVSAFETSFRHLIMRHESLRTSFIISQDGPVQHILPQVNFAIQYPDFDGAFDIQAVMRDFVQAFDLAAAPLLRIQLIKRSDHDHLLFFDMHHIISDALSMNILIHEFTQIYMGMELISLPIQFKDYAHWQARKIASGVLEEQEKYWLTAMAGEIPQLDLPGDYPRPAIKVTRGRRLTFVVEEPLQQQIRDLCQETDSTPFMFLLALFNVWLAKLTGQDDIIVGSPIAGRGHPDLENIIGAFINTLAYRNYPSHSKSFAQFLDEVKQNCIAAQQNQDYQYEELVERIVNKRDLSRGALFDVMLVMQNMDFQPLEIPGLDLVPYDYEQTTSKFDLTLTVVDGAQGFEFSIAYCSALFEEATIHRFIGYFKSILLVVLEKVNITISDIDILSQADKKQLELWCNGPNREVPVDKSLADIFSQYAVSQPGALALIASATNNKNDESEERMTYEQLDLKARQLAIVLRERGVTDDTIVALKVSRSAAMIISIMGILHAGGAYMPIDTDAPMARMEYMMADSGALLMLAEQKKTHESWLTLDYDTVMAQSHQKEIRHSLSTTQSPRPDSLAYVIYTSGSTGKPKGVMVTQKNVVNLVTGLEERVYRRHERDVRVSLVAPYVFDASVKQVFGALLLGHCLVVVPEEIRLHGAKLWHFFQHYKITVSDATPAHIYMLSDVLEQENNTSEVAANKSYPTHFLVGGDALPVPLVQRFYRYFNNHNAPIITNIYGPTECTVDSTAFDVMPQQLEHMARIPIGTPLINQSVFIVDDCGHFQPIGIPGELCISGPSVSRGYLNRPELTAQQFVDSTHRTQRSYKTGDLACWLPDGNIQYLGRVDRQVKIRGYRIELGEIEQVLQGHKYIKDAVVIVGKDDHGAENVCAYFVKDQEIDDSQLRDYLSSLLPQYMIPSFFVSLAKIPLTANGKVDRGRLPVPGLSAAGADYTAPRTSIEEKLVSIWHQLPGLSDEGIGIDNNFFEIGGHSLTAITLVTRLQKSLNIDLPLTEVFKHATVRQMAEFIKTNHLISNRYQPIQVLDKQPFYPLSSTQKRLYILQKSQKQSIRYNIPVLLNLFGDLDKDKIIDTFNGLVNRHESLRTSFRMEQGDPVQEIAHQIDFQIQYHSLLSPVELGHLISSLIQPFDLSQSPLLRVAIIERSVEEHIMVMDMHHIISDGVSMSILVSDFVQLYVGKTLIPPSIHYKDFASWQNNQRDTEVMKEQESYWLKQLQGDLPVLQLPVDNPESVTDDDIGNVLEFDVSGDRFRALNRLANTEGVTMFMLLAAIFNVLLFKLSSQEDIIIGIPISGRMHPDIQQTIGMFVNTLLLRNNPTDAKPFGQFLSEVKGKSLEAFDNQDYQYEDLVNALEDNSKTGQPGNTLFNVAFAYQGDNTPMPEIPGLRLEPYKYESHTSKFDLTLMAVEAQNCLKCTIEYRCSLFKESTIQRYIQYIKEIIDTVSTQHSNPLLSEIKLTIQLSEPESTMVDQLDGDFGF
jgi:tyrocidine synthetase III